MWFLNPPLEASTSPSPSGPCVASPESHLSSRRIFQARTEAALGMEGGSRVTVPTRHTPLQSAVVFAKQPFLLFFFCLAYGSSHCKPARFPRFCFLRACSVAQKCLTLRDAMDCSPPGSSVLGDSLGKNPGVGCHALPQEIFPTLHLLCLLHWQGGSLPLILVVVIVILRISTCRGVGPPVACPMPPGKASRVPGARLCGRHP